MILSVASGKGGTGKTLVATSLALSLKGDEKVQLLDCDVEEPNVYIFLKPEITGSEQIFIPVPHVDDSACTRCGRCAEVCTFHAIAVFGKHVLTFPELCHGCGACSYLCPEKAITEKGRESGTVEWGHADAIAFAHGRLNIGEAMAPPVIRKVKELTQHDGVAILDAPPGTSCPVVETVRGSDFCLLVTEPTLSGIHDLERILSLCRHFNVRALVCINKYDINEENTRHIEKYCLEQGIEIAARIPFDNAVTEAIIKGKPVVEYCHNSVARRIEHLWEKIASPLAG